MFKVLLDISRPWIRKSCLCRVVSKLYLSMQDRKCCEGQVYVGKDVILEIHIKLYFDCTTGISHFHLCSLHLVLFKRVTFRSKSVFWPDVFANYSNRDASTATDRKFTVTRSTESSNFPFSIGVFNKINIRPTILSEYFTIADFPSIL